MSEERYEPDEVDLGEPVEASHDVSPQEEYRPDAEELQSQISETRKPMGPPLEEDEEDANAPEADAPPPPPTEPEEPA
jgi:hypothetical protein